MTSRAEGEQSISRRSVLARLFKSEVLVNVPVAVFVFLIFLAAQSAMLTTLMDPPVHAELPQITALWIGTLLHALLTMLLVMLVLGWLAPHLPKAARALMWAAPRRQPITRAAP